MPVPMSGLGFLTLERIGEDKLGFMHMQAQSRLQIPLETI